MKFCRVIAGIGIVLLGGGAKALAAQSGFGITPMAQGILTVDQVHETPLGGPLTEVRLVEPVIMATGYGFHGLLHFTATLDFEGLTMPGGELAPGDWGEGFVDRRHPHTYAHELIVSLVDPLGKLDGSGRLGISVGKGFVPFGSDDPMSRPFVRYPVNHHLAQILERAVATVQYELGPVTVEGAAFDGDEPTKASDWPLLREDGTWRFGDSHAGRLTIRPLAGLEVQGSLAHVHSPESRPGAGPDVDKQSASIRFDRSTARGEHYAMLEWARSSELGGFFVYHSILGEALTTIGRARVSYRFENTERPEELRLADPFRTLRPSPDNDILGISRWALHTVHVAYDMLSPHGKILVEPFVEGTLGRVAKAGGGVFDPIALYGTDKVRSISVGVVASFAMRGHRMGRYGVLSGAGVMRGMVM